MFMYEKDGKLMITFEDTKPVEQPDIIIEKDKETGITKVHIGEQEYSDGE